MKRRLIGVYAVLHPGKTRGLAPWFTRECQAHGVDVSLSSIWRYLHGGTPTPEVLSRMLEVLDELEIKADLAKEENRVAEIAFHESRLEELT